MINSDDPDWKNVFTTVIYQYLERHYVETRSRFQTDERYEEWLNRIFGPFWTNEGLDLEELRETIHTVVPRYLTASKIAKRLVSSGSSEESLSPHLQGDTSYRGRT